MLGKTGKVLKGALKGICQCWMNPGLQIFVAESDERVE